MNRRGVQLGVLGVLGLAVLAVAGAMVLGRGESPQRGVPGHWQVTLGSATWTVELAVTPEQQQRGLGGRHHLGADRGMLFVFGDEQPRTFVMRDCYIPLDIAFLDAHRRVVAIHTMHVEADRVGRVPYRSGAPAMYALEVNAGDLERAGVRVGDQAAFSGMRGR